MTDPEQNEKPSFSVVTGNPTATELAAVTAVVTALLEENESNPEVVEQPARSAWSYAQLRTPIVPGPDAWQHSVRQ